MTWQSRNGTRDQVAAALLYSKDIRLENIREGYVHGFGIIVQMIENITLDGLVFDTPEGSSRATSSSADDINLSGVKGKVDIQNCTFRNPHDDPINVHGTFLLVTQKVASNKIKVTYQHNETAGFPNYFVGNQIEFAVKGSMAAVENSVRTVTAVDGPDGFDGNMGEGSGDIRSIILTLDQDIPEEVTANNYLVENITYTPEVYIANNRFISSPTRGILCTTRGKVTIENNLFDNMRMAGIYISSDGQSWYESGRFTDVTIRNNIFVNGSSQDIFVEPTNPSVSAGTPVHHNLLVEGNTFYADGRKVLDAKSTEGIVFRNNQILRKDPIRSMSFTAPKDTLSVGESMNVSASASMNTVNANLFRFNGSSNITFENNTYDPGVKPNIETASGTNASHITANNDAAAIGAGVVAESLSYYYESSNPEVASVSLAGTVTAKKEGTAVITAYVISGTRKFIAGSQAVTVSAGQADTAVSLRITGLPQTMDVHQTATLSVSDQDGTPVTPTWTVTDPATGQASAAVTVDDNGNLVAAGGGVAIVTASAKGASVSKAVAVNEPLYALKNATILTERNPEGTITNKDSLTIEALWQGLYQEQNPANTIAFDVPEGTDRNNFTVEVSMSGHPSGSWGSCGLYLINDADNYVSVERKNRGGTTQKMAVVSEKNQHASESWQNGSEGSAAHISDEEVDLKIEVVSGTANAYYRTASDTDWKSVASTDMSFLGDSFKIGMTAVEDRSSVRGQFVTFKDLKVDGEIIEMTQPDPDAQAPELENASLATAADGTTVSVTAAGAVSVVYEAADAQDGEYTVVPSMTGTTAALSEEIAGKWLRAQVYPTQGTMVGEPVVTNAVHVEKAVNPFAQMKNSETRLKTLSIGGVEGVSDLDVNTRNHVIQAAENEREITLDVKALDPEAQVTVRRNNHFLTPAENGKINASLVPGYNVFEIMVKSEDQKFETFYRVQVFHNGDADTTLSSVTVNGEAAEIGSNDTASYTVAAGTTHAVVDAVTSSKFASCRILKDGQDVGGKPVELQEGANEFVISSSSEVHQPARLTRLTVYVPTVTNNALKSADFGTNAALDQEFNAAVLEYTGKMFGEFLPFTFTAQEAQAKVEVFKGNETTPLVSGTGKAEWDVVGKIGEDTVLNVKVTSPNGESVKTYKFTMTAIETQYASDMTFKSATSGDSGNPVRRDKSCSDKTMKLYDGSAEKTYSKGIGTHGKSEIVIDLEGKNFDRFTAEVGVDRNITKTDEARETFTVYVDGTAVFESGEMNYNTPLKKVDVSVKGAKEIKLVLDFVDHNWSCHGNWADAKFTFGEETVDAAVTAGTGGQVSGIEADQKVYKGQHLTLNAVPDTGYVFAGWKDANGKTVSTDASYTFKADNAFSLEAVFEKDGEEAPADKSALQALIDEIAAAKLAEKDYTPISWSALEKAREAADAVLAKANATQAEIDAAKTQLQAAYDGLNAYSQYDRSLLMATADKANLLDFTKLYPEDREKLLALMPSVDYVYNNPESQKQIDDKASEFNKALLSVRRVPSKAELEALGK